MTYTLHCLVTDISPALPFYLRQAVIVIPQAHVIAFSEECDVTKEQAESLLRKHGGNFKVALSAYIKGI